MGSGLRQKLEALFPMNTKPDAYAFCCMPFYKVCRPEVSEFFESNHYSQQPETHEAQPWDEVIAERMLEGVPLVEKQKAWERFVKHLRDLKRAREEAGSLLNE